MACIRSLLARTQAHSQARVSASVAHAASVLRLQAMALSTMFRIFLQKDLNTDLKGKTVAISGFGNVAWGAAQKATELGAKVVTISGPDGYIYDPRRS